MQNCNLQLSINFDQEICVNEMRIPSLVESNSDSKAFAELEDRADVACHFFDDFDEELKASNQGSMLEVRSYRFGDSSMDVEQEALAENLLPDEKEFLDLPKPHLDYSQLIPLEKLQKLGSEQKNGDKIIPPKKVQKISSKRKMITQKIQEIFKHKTQRRRKLAPKNNTVQGIAQESTAPTTRKGSETTEAGDSVLCSPIQSLS